MFWMWPLKLSSQPTRYSCKWDNIFHYYSSYSFTCQRSSIKYMQKELWYWHFEDKEQFLLNYFSLIEMTLQVVNTSLQFGVSIAFASTLLSSIVALEILRVQTRRKSPLGTVRMDSSRVRLHWGYCQVQAPFDQLEQVLLRLDYFLKSFPTWIFLWFY